MTVGHRMSWQPSTSWLNHLESTKETHTVLAKKKHTRTKVREEVSRRMVKSNHSEFETCTNASCEKQYADCCWFTKNAGLVSFGSHSRSQCCGNTSNSWCSCGQFSGRNHQPPMNMTPVIVIKLPRINMMKQGVSKWFTITPEHGKLSHKLCSFHRS